MRSDNFKAFLNWLGKLITKWFEIHHVPWHGKVALALMALGGPAIVKKDWITLYRYADCIYVNFDKIQERSECVSVLNKQDDWTVYFGAFCIIAAFAISIASIRASQKSSPPNIGSAWGNNAFLIQIMRRVLSGKGYQLDIHAASDNDRNQVELIKLRDNEQCYRSDPKKFARDVIGYADHGCDYRLSVKIRDRLVTLTAQQK